MSHGSVPRAGASTKTDSVIKVLVVDDSLVIRGIVTRWIDAAPDMVTAGVAQNGREAIERTIATKPDIIILDIEMPVMDGITALPHLLQASPFSKIIMASTLSRRNAEISLKALALGATDYVPKPTSLGGGEAAEEFRRELLARISAMGRRKPAQVRLTEVPAATPSASATFSSRTPEPNVKAGRTGVARPLTAGPATAGAIATVKTTPGVLRKASLIPPQILVIGSSTGGPQALVQVVQAIAPQLNVPVLITQHMPAMFTAILAESLSRSSGLKCVEGVNGMKLEAGHVYIAPGDYHMTIKGKGGPIELNQNPPENFCRPAVDPMFRSVASAYGAATLAVVLTGMGYDGREGARSVAGVNGTILAQDEATSVVWGMPGSVTQAGLASAVLPLHFMGVEIRKLLGLKSK